MKNALISPNESAYCISAWELVGGQYVPVYTVVGQRIAETAAETFEVAPPLFWVSCADDVVDNAYYYAADSAEILPIPAPAPKPVQSQPAVDGAQTL